MNLKSTVLWIGTIPKNFGYDLHSNVVAKPPKGNVKMIDSYIFDYSFEGPFALYIYYKINNMPPKDLLTLRLRQRPATTIRNISPSAYPTFGTAVAIPFVPASIPNYSFTIRGLGGILTQNDLASKLTGETITSFTSQSTDIFVSSSTTYTINVSAFRSTSSITAYIDTDGGCTSISDRAFQDSSIVSASFPSATLLRFAAFSTCTSLVSASFPLVTSTENSIFNNCSSLTSVSFPLLTNIQSSTFNGCTSLVSASFPSALSINGSAFYSCSLLSTANFPSATSIGLNAFYDCTSLSSINFPLAVTIGIQAFTNCPSLVSASFPSATSIGANALKDCTSLKYINLPSISGSTALGGSTGDDNVFFNVSSSGNIYIPSFYSQSNAGGLDGDLSYLSSSLNWTINWL